MGIAFYFVNSLPISFCASRPYLNSCSWSCSWAPEETVPPDAGSDKWGPKVDGGVDRQRHRFGRIRAS